MLKFVLVSLALAIMGCRLPPQEAHIEVEVLPKGPHASPLEGRVLDLTISIEGACEMAELFLEARKHGNVTFGRVSVGGLGEFEETRKSALLSTRIWILDSKHSVYAIRRETSDPAEFYQVHTSTSFEGARYGGGRVVIPRSTSEHHGFWAAGSPSQKKLNENMVPILVVSTTQSGIIKGGGYTYDKDGNLVFDSTCDHFVFYLQLQKGQQKANTALHGQPQERATAHEFSTTVVGAPVAP